MSLPRELIRWLQTLDLPLPVKNPRRDLANGYLFAEICARYWGESAVDLHSYENKHSLTNKQANWKVLKKALTRAGFPVDEVLVEAVINAQEGAAVQMLSSLYTVLTRREIQIVPPLQEAEVAQVPTFLKTTHVTTIDMASLQQPTVTTTEQAQPSTVDEQKEKEQQRQQKLRAARSKPKPAMKVHTIRAPEAEGDDTVGIVPVTFSQVTVKALPPQMLSRFSHSGVGASESPQAADKKRNEDNEGNEENNVISLLSDQIEEVMRRTTVEGAPSPCASWPLTSTVPTVAEFFATYNGVTGSIVSPSAASIIWQHLISCAEATAKWILSRPRDCTLFLELFHRQTTLRVATLKASDPQIIHLKTVFSMLSSLSPMTAQSIFKMFVLPFVVPLLQTAANKDGLRKLICTSIFYPLLQEGKPHSLNDLDDTDEISLPSNVTAFILHLHDAFMTPPIDVYNDNSQVTTECGDFYSFLLTLRGLVEAVSAATSKTLRRRAGEKNTFMVTIGEDLAMAAYYNCVAGLCDQGAKIRCAAIGLLTSLVKAGHAELFAEHHVDLLENAFCKSSSFVFPRSLDTACELVLLLCAVARVARQAEARGLEEAISGKSPHEEEEEEAKPNEITVTQASEAQLMMGAAEAEAFTRIKEMWERAMGVIGQSVEFLTSSEILPSGGTSASIPLLFNLRLFIAHHVGSILHVLGTEIDQEAAACRILKFMIHQEKSHAATITALFGTSPNSTEPTATVSGITLLGTHVVHKTQKKWDCALFMSALCRVMDETIEELDSKADPNNKVASVIQSGTKLTKRLIGLFKSATPESFPQDATHVLVSLYLHWLHRLFVVDRSPSDKLTTNGDELFPGSRESPDTSEASSPAPIEDENVDKWWALMRKLTPILDTSIYLAKDESLEDSLVPSHYMLLGLKQMGLFASRTAVRLYVDFSGEPHAGDVPLAEGSPAATFYDVPHLVTKGVDWLRNIVANST